MKRAVVATGTALLLLLASGCGDMSQDEVTASKSIAKTFAGTDPSKTRAATGRCVGDAMVGEAGVDQLKKDKLITKELAASKAWPTRLSDKTAKAYADAMVKCYDFDDNKAEIRKQSGATRAQVDAYVACLKKIDKDDLRQALIDQKTKSKPTAVTKKLKTQSEACGKKLGV